MAETWTFSEWSIGGADPTAFLNALGRSAHAVTKLGGAHEGTILEGAEDPAHLVVVRHWADAEAVARRADEQGNHAGDLCRRHPTVAEAP
jgi:hypothetical protein